MYLLKYTSVVGAKSSLISHDQNLKFSKESSKPIPNPITYKRVIGRLIYLTIIIPNISYLVQLLS